MNEYQKLRDAVHLLLCLFVPFCISSAAFGMGDSFLILRGGGEIWGGLACALVFSCLFVFLLFGGIKLLRGQKPQLIRLRGIAFALLAGVLAALHIDHLLTRSIFLHHPHQKCRKRATKCPLGSVYLLENPHFLPFFVADSVPGSIILCKGDRE